MRLHRFLARAGVAARRHCEALIRAGRVSVDGQVVQDPGFVVRPGQHRVEVDGRVVQPEAPVYVALHKPRGLLSAARDPRGRPTVVDWVRRTGGPRVRLYPVGRLDQDSEGLLLLTNDGDLAFALTHPSRGVEKAYRVWVRGRVAPQAVQALRHGVRLEDGWTAPARVRVVWTGPNRSVLELVLHEGRKRQVRRMCLAVGHPVLRLVRTRIGPLSLRDLAPGQWRYLSPEEVRRLRQAACAGPAGQSRHPAPATGPDSQGKLAGSLPDAGGRARIAPRQDRAGR